MGGKASKEKEKAPTTCDPDNGFHLNKKSRKRC
jgi:hypothetical protein